MFEIYTGTGKRAETARAVLMDVLSYDIKDMIDEMGAVIIDKFGRYSKISETLPLKVADSVQRIAQMQFEADNNRFRAELIIRNADPDADVVVRAYAKISENARKKMLEVMGDAMRIVGKASPEEYAEQLVADRTSKEIALLKAEEEKYLEVLLNRELRNKGAVTTR